MALEGTIKTPLGTVQKKTALLLGGGIVVLGAIVWYRQKQVADSATAATTTEAAINPATGYPYGSAEDAAELASQAAYVSPPASSGGGSSVPTSNVGYTSNGAWVQGVISYMVGNDLIADPTALSAALGKYITGAYCTDAEQSLIQQAIAVQGFPPIAGANGYPPSINKTPTVPNTNTGMTPVAGSWRGYGWYKAVAGDTPQKVADKFNIPIGSFYDWNSGLTHFPVGKWLKIRGGSNPTWGYNGK
jgi:hypothetical protein